MRESKQEHERVRERARERAQETESARARKRERHLRETEEQRGGSHQEQGGRRHGDVAAGSEGAGRSGGRPTDPTSDPPAGEARHPEVRSQTDKGGGGGEQGGGRPPIYCDGFFSMGHREDRDQGAMAEPAMGADRKLK